MKLQTAVMRLSSPSKGEFGYTHLKESVLYANFDFVWQDLSWFIANGEFEDPCIWLNPTDSTLFNNTQIIMKSTFKDGAFPMDDIDITLAPISANNRFALKKVVYDDVANPSRKYVIITKNTKTEDFYKELRDYCVIKTYAQYTKALDWLIMKVNGKNSFAAQKEMMAKLTNKVANGTAQVNQHLVDYFNSFMNRASSVKLNVILPFDDTDLLNFYHEVYSTDPGFGANKLVFFDERSVLASSRNSSIKDLRENMCVYLGRTKAADLGANFFLVTHTGEKNCSILEFVMTSDYSSFHIKCVGDITEKNGRSPSLTSDIVKSNKICQEVRKFLKISEDNEIPGCVENIDIEHIDAVMTFLDNHCSSSPSFDILDKARYNINDWSGKFTNTVKVKISKPECIYLSAFEGKLEDLTNQRITEFNNCISKFSDQWIQYKDPFEKSRVADRKDQLANRIGEVYTILKNPIKAHIHLMLGNSKIDRPYVILTSDSGEVRPDPARKFTSTFDMSTSVSRNDPVILPDFSCLPILIALRGLLKEWSAVFEQAEIRFSKMKVAYDDPESVSNKRTRIHRMLNLMYKNLCEENGLPYVELTDLTSMNASGRSNFIIWHNSVKHTVDLNALRDFQLLNTLYYIAMNEMIENGTFFNTKGSSNILARPADTAASVLRDNSYLYWKLMRSIYA